MRYRRLGLAVLLAVAALVALPLLADSYLLQVLTFCFIWAVLAASWDLLSGYAGQISFGHAGFFGFGAYVAAIVSTRTGAGAYTGMLLGGLGAGLFGLVLGFPALRLRGHYLAIVTLGFAEVVRLVANNWMGLTNGPSGMLHFGTFPGLPADPKGAVVGVYFLALGLMTICCTAMWWIGERTATGKVFKAIREDEVLAGAMGYNTTFYKLLAFAVSAAFAGTAGGFYAYYVQLVNPTVASTYVTNLAIGMAVFGGIGTIVGAVIGSLLLYVVYSYLPFLGVVVNQIAIGLVIMVFVVFAPRGCIGLLRGYRPRWLRRQTDDPQDGPQDGPGSKLEA